MNCNDSTIQTPTSSYFTETTLLRAVTQTYRLPSHLFEEPNGLKCSGAA